MTDILPFIACGSQRCTGHTDLALVPGDADRLADLPSGPEIDSSRALNRVRAAAWPELACGAEIDGSER